ncbi:MAG: EamA family transporter [Xanthobacteraceae bacterium]
MTVRDGLLAAAVAVVWGLAFIASKLALREVSPLVLTALRFAFAALPCLVVRRPPLSWPLLIGLSATLFVGQFAAQFYGLAHGVPAGLTSVIVQGQVLFTIGFAAMLFRELPGRIQLFGMAVSVSGLLMICATLGGEFSATTFALTMISPVSFAIGNLLLRRAAGVQMFDLMAWMSLVVPLPLLLAAMASDGIGPTLRDLAALSPTGWGAALLLGVVATTFAYWAWGHLLQRYAAAEVVPFALLVPVVASIAGAAMFGERFAPLRLAGMVALVAGVALSVLLGRPRTARVAIDVEGA